jgi:nucleoside-diphosphate-sugar epimerase
MKALVTGSAGHLGEALVRVLRERQRDVAGLDILPSPFTTHVGSIGDRALVQRAIEGVDTVFHAATLHKPHVATHSRQDFVDTNVTGTLTLLEAAASAGVDAFVFTSTTSVFGDAMRPAPGAPAVWITEDTVPLARNIYGATKLAAEDFCRLFQRNHGLPCIVLRTSRFFPEDDDNPGRRAFASAENIKANEFLNRRVDLEDVVDAHLLAAERAEALGFGKYIVSATTPFAPADMEEVGTDAAGAVARYVPEYAAEYARRGWRMFPALDRVYDNARARADLGWRPRYDFRRVVALLKAGRDMGSPLARVVGAKGYHAATFSEGPYPVE